jgi:thymidylate synthase ThyX
MGFEVKVLADSIARSGARLTTISARYPRSIHAEWLTHRMLSRNSASSRAIPTEKLIAMIEDDPFIPEHIGKNQKGMQASEQLSGAARDAAVELWLMGKDSAVKLARQMLSMGVHKQVVNRVIEPWMWITVIYSGTEWDNVWALRCHEAAEPHFQIVAYMARDAIAASTPAKLDPGEWHLPLIGMDQEDGQALNDIIAARHGVYLEKEGHKVTLFMARKTVPPGEHDELLRHNAAYADLAKISVGRCARVSYLTHEGKRDPNEDVALHDRLVVQRPLHASPAEHVAQAQDEPSWSGNFFGFTQYRKTLEHERVGRAP